MSDENTTTDKKKNIWKVILTVTFGVALVVLGMTEMFSTPSVNNVLVQTGANQATNGVLEMYPDSADMLEKAADVIDAAVLARKADPSTLAVLIHEQVESTVPGLPVDAVVSAVIDQLNTAYETSDTEEKYLTKVSYIVKGIRAAVAVSKSSPAS